MYIVICHRLWLAIYLKHKAILAVLKNTILYQFITYTDNLTVAVVSIN